MMNFRAVLFITGILLSGLAIMMVIPLLVEIFYDKALYWHNFAISIFITGFFGSALALSSRPQGKVILGTQEAFVVTTLIWIIACLFSGLPFYFSSISIPFVDACFESVSALTTTGYTVLKNLDNMPKGILLWRAILQWLGGIGIIVMAMTIFPALRIGGMQLFRSEFSDRSEKILPRVSQIASALLTTYFLFTLSCLILLYFLGMPLFDSVCHAMAAISTGGLSIHDASISYYNNVYIEIILIVFMIIGGSTLILYVRLWNGDFKAFKDYQLRTYLVVIMVLSLILTCWYFFSHSVTFGKALRHGTFAVVSIITSTGFSSDNYLGWGSFASVLFFMLSFIGGCTGSTSGGIKIFRFQVLYALAKNHLLQLRRPYSVYVPMYQNQRITDSVASSVFTFIILYWFSMICITLALSFFGLDFSSSLCASACSLGNIGMGSCPSIDPSFSISPNGPKWVMMLAMILGRLEFLTVIVLLMPTFWKD